MSERDMAAQSQPSGVGPSDLTTGLDAEGSAAKERPAWLRVNDLFARHGLAPPPTRLRDQLVSHLMAFDREECAARAEWLAQNTGSGVPTPNSPTPSALERSSGAKPLAGFRWTEPPVDWSRRFAFLPVGVGREWVWLRPYWTMPEPMGGNYVRFDPPSGVTAPDAELGPGSTS